MAKLTLVYDSNGRPVVASRPLVVRDAEFVRALYKIANRKPLTAEGKRIIASRTLRVAADSGGTLRIDLCDEEGPVLTLWWDRATAGVNRVERFSAWNDLRGKWVELSLEVAGLIERHGLTA